jgi:hypothetical protein
MARVLIPFSDLASGQRAVRRLLQEARDPRQSVELLAMVDPLTSGKVAVFVSRAQPKRNRAPPPRAGSSVLRRSSKAPAYRTRRASR